MHSATRQIGIDMGHRVTNHGSKCRNIHGHRYTIEATMTGALVPDGASEGMVLDFGFLKEEMMREIDEPCDHGLCLWIKDPLVQGLLDASGEEWEYAQSELASGALGYSTARSSAGKLYLMAQVPTAENLAEHWYRRLAPKVAARTDGRAWLTQIRVWETPNCYADYFAPPTFTAAVKA